ncbi:HAD family hydrolase [Microbacterium sp. NPDC087665]|uniref:HAD family hydrolase n=1 Tax=Microbacterium sp. NPDC087665 TaxID=3364194 RepID=UPI0038258B58
MSTALAAAIARPRWMIDLDDTLIDSTEAHRKAFEAVLSRMAPTTIRLFDYASVRGMSTRTALRALGIEDTTLVDTILRTKQALYRQAVDDGEVVALPGARRLLSTLHDEGRPAMIVTSGSRSSAAAALSATGLIPFIAGLVTAEDAERSKPAGDPYVVACERSGCRPEEAVAVEDSANGIVSALSAGLAVIGVGGHRPAHVPGLPSIADLAALLEASIRMTADA